MIEYKCDFCEKVVIEKDHPGSAIHRNVAGAWEITIGLNRRCEGEYCNGQDHILICDDCIEKIKARTWGEFTAIDDKVTSAIIVKALAVTGHFDNVHKTNGLPVIGETIEPTGKQKLKNITALMVDALHPDALEQASNTMEKLRKLGIEAQKKMLVKFDEFIDKKAGELTKTGRNDDATGAEA